MNAEERSTKEEGSFGTREARDSKSSTLIGWAVFVGCLVVVGCLFFGPEQDAATNKTKLFGLFENEKHAKLQKKLDKALRVILIGDEEDGVGIFVNQYINERATLGKEIKRRTYLPSRNLEHRDNNIFAKGYGFLKRAIAGEPSNTTLWVIQTENSLTMDNLEEIFQFSQKHPNANFLVVTEAVPKEAAKAFPSYKIIKFEELSMDDVLKFMTNGFNLDKVQVNNLFKGLDNHLDRIDEFIHSGDHLNETLAATYAKQAENLETLLAVNEQSVEKLLRGMCKKGFVKAKAPYDFIPVNNGVIEYSKQDSSYRWYSQKAIFAVSDKYNVVCQTHVELIHLEGISQASFVPPQPSPKKLKKKSKK